jgi:hypothetical protein
MDQKGNLKSKLTVAQFISSIVIHLSNELVLYFRTGQQQWASPKNTVKTGAPVQAQQGWPANQPLGWNAGQMPIAGQPGIIPAGGQWPASSGQPMMVPTNSMPMTYGVQVL